MRTKIDQQFILDHNRRFHDEVEADSYDQRMGVDHGEAAIKRMIAELEYVLGKPLPRGGRVIDVASGTGNVAVKLALTAWYDEVVAIDISQRSLDVAKARAKALGTDLTTLESDMLRLPFEGDTIDFLVGCAFLHHLPDPVAFMREVHRVLKPGAEFVIIGEPTSFGMKAINVTKSPLALANRVLRSLRKDDKMFRWDHDSIDVHDFTWRDAQLLLEPFSGKRIITEGFASPILDQGLFTPIRLVLGSHKVVTGVLSAFAKATARADQLFFNRILPSGMKASMKLSGRKAASP